MNKTYDWLLEKLGRTHNQRFLLDVDVPVLADYLSLTHIGSVRTLDAF